MGVALVTPDNPLTKVERQFAEEQHDIIVKYLRIYCLPDADYDVVVFGYLRAVRIYLERTELQKYKFSTIAFNCMFAELAHHRDKENRKLNNRALSLDYKPEDSYSLYEQIEDKNVSSFEDEGSPTPLNPLYKFTDVLSDKQRAIIMLHTSGYTYREIGEIVGLTEQSAKNVAYYGRKKVIAAAEKYEKTARAAGTA